MITATPLTLTAQARRALAALTGQKPSYTQAKRYEHAAILAREADRARRAERKAARQARAERLRESLAACGKALFAAAAISFAMYHWIVVGERDDRIAAERALADHHAQAARDLRSCQHTLTLVGTPHEIARAATAAGKALERKP